MPFNLNLEKASPTTITVALEPTRSVLAGMVMLTKDEDLPGISNWFADYRRKMTKKQKFQHTLVVIGFYHAIAPEDGSIPFQEHINRLAQTDPQILLQRMFHAYVHIGAEHGRNTDVDWKTVLSSAENYIAFLKERFGPEAVIDEIETEAFEYLADPASMRTLIVNHLQKMWDEVFGPEWTRVEPMLKEAVKAFQSTDFSKMDRFEATRFVTGQDLDEEKWKPALERANRIIFIPNAHIGPYVSRLPDEKDMVILFGARQPENAPVRVPELDRADMVTRLTAIADDTRLQILQMIRERGEMRAQEVMDATQLSQPSVSRYLGQLTATGFLQERRVNGAKAYVLNRERIVKTLKAVSVSLLGQE